MPEPGKHALLEVAERALDSIGAWKEPSAGGVVRGYYASPVAQWAVVAHTEEAGWLVFYSEFPLPVPSDRLPAVAEFVMRANYGLVIGNFELDLDDGRIRYKASIDFGAMPPSQALADRILGWNVGTMARYLPGIMVVVAGADPRSAVSEIESDSWTPRGSAAP
ncbi:MAG TPA: YbjN domain-containing protein [Solirubrobacteraceae bacterium]|jgi:hypothetical protein|nr:YbjN domain-containing protein [Solirubrobacteraceae bacterium]